MMQGEARSAGGYTVETGGIERAAETIRAGHARLAGAGTACTPGGASCRRNAVMVAFASASLPASSPFIRMDFSQFFANVSDIFAALFVPLVVWVLFWGIRGRRLREAERQQRREHHLLRAIHDASPVPHCIKDANRCYIGCNRAFEAFFGVHEGDIVGRTALDVLPHAMAVIESTNEEDMLLYGRQSSSYISEATQRTGDVRSMHVSCSAWQDDEGVLQGLINAYADITELKRVEAALHDSEARNRTLVEEAPISIMSFDAAGHVNFVNKWHLRVFCRNRVDERFFLGRRLDALPGLSRAGLCEGAARVLQGEELSIREVYFPEFTGGHDGWVSIRGVPIRRDGQIVGGILIREDITERKRVEDVLRQREALVSSMLRNLPIDFWASDWEGNVLLQSDESMRVWGRLPLGGEPLTTAPYCWQTSDSFEKRVFEGDTVERELPVVLPSGQERIFNVIAAPVRLQNGITAMLRVNLDITERKRALEELRTARDAAEAANKAKSEFLAHMSHELRTPLNGVMGMLQLLDEHVTDSRGRQWLDIALESSGALLRILSDILDLSRIEAGRLDLVHEPFTSHSVVTPVLASLARAVEGRPVTLTGEVPDDMPPVLIGDPGRIRQVLFNLVGNAVKYTEKGRVMLGMRVLRADAEALLMHFSVVDTGVGIADNQLQKTFEPFSRLRQGSGLPSGVGLGLPIVVRLVRLMGGALCISSETGVGTEVHFVLPLLVAPEGTIPLSADEDDAASLGVAAWRGMSLRGDAGAATGYAGQQVPDTGMPDSLMPDSLMPDTGLASPAASGGVCGSDIAGGEGGVPLSMPGAEAVVAGGEGGGASCAGDPTTSVYGPAPVGVEGGGSPGAAPVLSGLASIRPDAPLVLLVEDDPVNLMAARRMLERLGCLVEVATCGQEAVDALRRGVYDVIFMDIQMPDYDGIETLRRVRAHGSGVLRPTTPAVAMTAFAMKGDRERFIEAGMVDYVSKPVLMKSLAAVLHRVLSFEVAQD